MTDTSVMNYALTSAAGATSTSSSTSSMVAAAAFYQQQAAASAALASLDPASATSHHHQPLASAAAASAAALANVDTPRYPWMSITGNPTRGQLFHASQPEREPKILGEMPQWNILYQCENVGR